MASRVLDKNFFIKKNKFKDKSGVICFFDKDKSSNSITDKISKFYEKYPFPDYDSLDDVISLTAKAEKGIFAKLLNESLPVNFSILEVGCGTGQLSNFLGIRGRRVFGIDLSLNSLKLAQKFKMDNNLSLVTFCQMDLFSNVFKEEVFDLVIANGVLHHTQNPFEAFKIISKLVRKNGYIIIGLYNKYGRIVNDLRGWLLKFFGKRALFLDRTVAKLKMSGDKRMAWYMDQYHNPHESRHTMDEVLTWFEKTNFEFINSFPKMSYTENLENIVFKKHSKGSIIERVMAQTSLIFNTNSEGGFFIMIGRKI